MPSDAFGTSIGSESIGLYSQQDARGFSPKDAGNFRIDAATPMINHVFGGDTDNAAARIDSEGDHRIAMAFAVAGLFAGDAVEIHGAECVDVSFPGFFETLASVVLS